MSLLASFTDEHTDTHTATINWGDGTATEPAVVTEVAGSGAVTGNHVYADNGTYTVAVGVTDSQGNSTFVTAHVFVNNVAPTVVAGLNQLVNVGQTVSLDPATFNDKGTLDTHTATIDWDDGTVDTGVVTESPFGPPGSTAGADGTVSGSHAYSATGPFTVQVCVTDDDGGISCDTFQVEVQSGEIEVPVDIKPQSRPNPLNVKSRGVLPVAVLGTTGFNVAAIDLTSIRLLGVAPDGVAPVRSAFEDVATPFTPFTGKGSALDCTDVGADGYLDLTLKFDTQQIVQAIGAVDDGDVLVLVLTGTLLDGTPIVGEDVVVIKKKGK